jgi:hypothetical protein
MHQEVAQGLPVVAQVAAAANEDFIPAENGAETASAGLGWDPFEVWRTRVKQSADLHPPREPGTRR